MKTSKWLLNISIAAGTIFTITGLILYYFKYSLSGLIAGRYGSFQHGVIDGFTSIIFGLFCFFIAYLTQIRLSKESKRTKVVKKKYTKENNSSMHQ